MNATGATGPWRRRARPLLGTLVEVGLRDGEAAGDGEGAARAAFEVPEHASATLLFTKILTPRPQDQPLRNAVI